MTLGQRLRQARLAAGLSQQQVCGEKITRNQLSLLEHDRTRPSLETLEYLAERLNAPVSRLLGEENANLAALEEVRRLWDDPLAALDALSQYRPDGTALDDVAAGLEAKLALRAATSRPELLTRALEANRRCRFSDPAVEAQAQLLRGLQAPDGAVSAAAEVFCGHAAPVLNLLARRFLAEGKPELALTLLDSAGTASDPTIRGRCLLALGRYGAALDAFRLAEPQTAHQDRAALWLNMETCCRELEDFRGAYEYARKIRENPT